MRINLKLAFPYMYNFLSVSFTSIKKYHSSNSALMGYFSEWEYETMQFIYEFAVTETDNFRSAGFFFLMVIVSRNSYLLYNAHYNLV